MSLETLPDGPTHRVRPVRAADLKHLAAIEAAGEPMFAEAFRDTLLPAGRDPLLSPPPRGVDRDDTPGFLLVAGPVGEPVGFVHVEVVEGFAHLAQLSVHPDAMRQGIGTDLVRAAMREARELGYDRLSLTTYRDLAWNGPSTRVWASSRPRGPSRSSCGSASTSGGWGWTGTVLGS